MGPESFIAELQQLGFEVARPGADLVTIRYVVPVGCRIGDEVQLGLQVPADFPLTPPGGLCVSPRILPINANGSVPHPHGGVHEAPQFGPDWEYWSRPHPNWAGTDRSVSAYMAHIRHLFDTL